MKIILVTGNEQRVELTNRDGKLFAGTREVSSATLDGDPAAFLVSDDRDEACRLLKLDEADERVISPQDSTRVIIGGEAI